MHVCDMCEIYNNIICVTWLNHMYSDMVLEMMTDSLVWHGSFIRVTWLIHKWEMTHSHGWEHGFFRQPDGCIDSYACHMSYSHASHDLSLCVTCLIRMYDVTDSYVWHDCFICVTCLIHMCDMTHTYVWHDSLTCIGAWLSQATGWTHLISSRAPTAPLLRDTQSHESKCLTPSNVSYICMYLYIILGSHSTTPEGCQICQNRPTKNTYIIP